MTDAKPKKSKKNQERNPEIVLCKMFTGNYWENENNLGHETINMFLPDGEIKKKFENRRSYIYLPASGDYDLTKHKIKNVLLVRSVPNSNGNTVQIIGKAEVVEEKGELLRDKLQKTCLSGGKEFVGLLNIFEIFNPNGEPCKEAVERNDVESKIKEIAEKYDMKPDSLNDYAYHVLAVRLGFAKHTKREKTASELYKLYNKKGKRLKADEKQKIIQTVLPTEYFDRIIDKDSQNEYNFWYAVIEGKNTDFNPEQDNNSMSKEDFCTLLIEKYNKALELKAVFEEQMEMLKDTKYAKISYREMFMNNEHFGKLNICVSLKVKKLQLVKKDKRLYLTTIQPIDENYIQIKKDVAEGDENQGKLSATSQKVYLPADIKPQGKDCELWDYLEEYKKDYWENAEPLIINKTDAPYLQDSYLTAIKKEYDELSYSNLFAYFFERSKQFVRYFFKNVEINTVNERGKLALEVGEMVSESISISDIDCYRLGAKAQVKREEKNIDIVLKDEKNIIVIENKIKSSLNGKEVTGESNENESFPKTFKDQLIRYYEYIESKYPSVNEKKYLIFAPDYNPIEEEDFGKTLNGKKMDEVWLIVRYSDIFNCCKKYYDEELKSDKNIKDDFNKNLFKEFLKALKVHTDSSANNYYRQMQKRLLRIKNEQGKNK